MGSFAAGSVVLVRFPFSDLSQSSWRKKEKREKKEGEKGDGHGAEDDKS